MVALTVTTLGATVSATAATSIVPAEVWADLAEPDPLAWSWLTVVGGRSARQSSGSPTRRRGQPTNRRMRQRPERRSGEGEGSPPAAARAVAMRAAPAEGAEAATPRSRRLCLPCCATAPQQRRSSQRALTKERLSEFTIAYQQVLTKTPPWSTQLVPSRDGWRTSRASRCRPRRRHRGRSCARCR